jgi:hypothetical protein
MARRRAGALIAAFVVCASVVWASVAWAQSLAYLDRDGSVRTTYDPARSFFPIGLYHALDGRHYGRDFDLRMIEQSGFNFVHPWEGQRDLRAFLDAAARAELKVFPAVRDLADARTIAGHPALLAWYVAEEPLYHGGVAERGLDELPRVRALMRDLKALDPARVSVILESPKILPPWREAWLAWAREAPLHALDIYPIVEDAGLEARRARLSYPRGIPEAISESFEATAHRRPVWLVVQAFASPFHWPVQRWLMPTPEELRAMAYAGVVAGATGLLYFALDSFVTRAGLVVGMAPEIPESHGPTPDYGGTGRPPSSATPEEREAGVALWAAMPRLNREIAELAPALLSPDTPTDFVVRSRGAGRLDAPVRVRVKSHPEGGAVLIAVNHERADAVLDLVFAEAPDTPIALTPDSPSLARAGTTLSARFAPFAVGVWRIPGKP